MLSLTKRFSLVVRFARIVLPEYRFIEPLLTWQKDVDFNEYLRKFREPFDYNDYRRFALRELLKLTLHIPGDTAEVGCYTGATSYLILKHIQEVSRQRNGQSFPKKKHFIFDSFLGLSTPGPLDGNHWSPERFVIQESRLRENLSIFSDDFTCYAGWVPQRFGEVEDRSFSFVHIDVDLYEPTKQSLEFFYSRMTKNGVIVIDDYGFDNNPGVNIASEEFFSTKSERLIAMPTGGAFVIKC